MIPQTTRSNRGPNRRGGLISIVLPLLIIGVAFFLGWRAYVSRWATKRTGDEQSAVSPAPRQDAGDRPLANVAENETPSRMAPKPLAQPKPLEQPVPAVQVKPSEQPISSKSSEPPKPSENPAEAHPSAAVVVSGTAADPVEEMRQTDGVKPLGSFAGIRFGEPIASGSPVKWGTALEESAGDTVAARGVAFAVYGPKLAKPFMSLGTSPLVWVTPKTRRPYRIEFSRELPAAGDRHDPETTNLVASLRARFNRDPFVTEPCVPGRAGCEYVFPVGSSTVTVGEYGGVLRFSVEREDIRDEARDETEILRREKGLVSADGAILDSKRYPNGGVDRTRYRDLPPFREGTPAAFCGVVFGSQPPETATVVVPQKGPKGFFLDYARAKCRPFRGFAYGRADVDPVRGGVYAVQLMSEGGTEGQDDRDFYESVKASLSEHYKVAPIEGGGAGAFSNLIYQVGDLTVAFGPDPRGGFRLLARNEVLTALAHAASSSASKNRKP